MPGHTYGGCPGAHIQAYDPAVAANPSLVPERFRPFLRATPLEAVQKADALAILTDWTEFKDVDLVTVRAAMINDLIFDGRNVLDQAEVEALGFAYIGVGRSATLPRRRRTDR